jgi:hypothetical protein
MLNGRQGWPERSAAAEIERATAALWAIPVPADRDSWWRICGSALAEGLDEGEILAWSEAGPNFSRTDARATIRSLARRTATGRGSLFAIARAAGWRDGGERFTTAPAKPAVRIAETATDAGKADRPPPFDFRAVWDASEAATAAHPYIQKKLGLPVGLRVVPDDSSVTIAGRNIAGWLAIPLFAQGTDVPASFQFISPAGEKLTAPGPMAGWFTVGGPMTGAATVFVTEGVGQAWACHQATQYPAVVTFGSSRTAAVVRGLRDMLTASIQTKLVLVPDVGVEAKACAIASEFGCAWVELPADLGRNGDANDLFQRDGPEALAQLLANPKEPDADDWPGTGAVVEFLHAPPPPVQWFAKERLLADRAHVLTGIGGSSKTRALYHLGIGAVLGRLPWAWEVARTGSAALFLAEDTAGGVHRTLAAMRDALGLTAEEIELLGQRLRVFPLAGRDTVLLEAGPRGALEESARVAQLLAALRNVPTPLAFIGLDPALGLTAGEELNPAHQRRLGEFADRLAIATGACVVLVSHAAKNLASADEIGSHSSRGSGALTDAVRGEFVLRTMTAAEARSFGIDGIEERKAHVQLVAAKGNELPPSAFVPVWLRRVAGGVLSPVELTAHEGRTVGQRELRALDVLRRLCAVAAPQLRDWRAACVAEGIISGSASAQEKTMERICSALLQSAMVERGLTRGVYVPASDVPDMHKPPSDPTTP